jgi:hypothetical protein
VLGAETDSVEPAEAVVAGVVISMMSGKVKGNWAKSELTEASRAGLSQYGETEHAAVDSVTALVPEQPLVVVQPVTQVAEALEDTVTVEHTVEQVEKVPVVHSEDDDDVLAEVDTVRPCSSRTVL